MSKILIVGAGVFGAAAAFSLQQRGHAVSLIDPGPIPHPDAASTDISKVVRLDYGDDDFYYDMAERALNGWDTWNAAWDEPLFHQVGFVMMKKNPMTGGTFEYESHKRLTERGYAPERLNSAALKTRYPVWNADNYVDGYRNPRAGWAESGRVVEKLVSMAQAVGVDVHPGQRVQHFIEQGQQVKGIITPEGTRFEADIVVLATGAWTPTLLPELKDLMWPSGMPVFHFTPPDPARFAAPNFCTWAADISETGWYGFPLHPSGVVKVGHHGAGIPVEDPLNLPDMPDEIEDRVRAFLAETFPELADAPVANTRICMYCDTWDGHFWIDHHPDRPGLMVAAGGSGHGFKFAPIIGDLIADVLEKKPNRFAHRFAWRERGTVDKEHARFSGSLTS